MADPTRWPSKRWLRIGVFMKRARKLYSRRIMSLVRKSRRATIRFSNPIEQLESRLFLTASVVAQIPPTLVNLTDATRNTLTLSNFFSGTKFTATSDNSKLVSAVINSGVLSLVDKGQPGLANIHVTATDTD